MLARPLAAALCQPTISQNLACYEAFLCYERACTQQVPEPALVGSDLPLMIWCGCPSLTKRSLVIVKVREELAFACALVDLKASTTSKPSTRACRILLYSAAGPQDQHILSCCDTFRLTCSECLNIITREPACKGARRRT